MDRTGQNFSPVSGLRNRHNSAIIVNIPDHKEVMLVAGRTKILACIPLQ
jgi:hypothetical protein